MDGIFQLSYALDTFYFLICGALVMWMAAGFTMLEAGLVRAKKHNGNTYQECGTFLNCVHHVHGLWLQHNVRWR